MEFVFSDLEIDMVCLTLYLTFVHMYSAIWVIKCKWDDVGIVLECMDDCVFQYYLKMRLINSKYPYG